MAILSTHVERQADVVDVLLEHIPELWAGAEDPLGDRPQATRRAWQALCDAGVGGILVPTGWGGQGGGLADAVALGAALSRIPAPVPFLSSAVLGTLLADGVGATSLLAELATGDSVVAVAEVAGLDPVAGGIAVRGLLGPVLHGHDADHWFVVGPTGGGATALAMLARPAVSLVRTADSTRPAAYAVLDGLVGTPVVGDVGALVGEAVRRAHMVRCAEALAAADVVVARDDDESRAALAAASSAVVSAAATTDATGTCPVDLTALALARTAQVVARVSVFGRVDGVRARMCLHRATGADGWLPHGGPGGDLGTTTRGAEVFL